MIVSLSGIMSDPLHASLIETDLISPGDKLITRDTVSQLDWLDVPQTFGATVADVLNGYGGFVNSGFRLATVDEMRTLFYHAGVVCVDISPCYLTPTSYEGWPDPQYYANLAGVRSLLNLMAGTTYSYLYAGIGPVSWDGWVGIAGLWNGGTTAEAYTTIDYQLASVAGGSFLVRPVPLPASFWLLSSALLALSGAVMERWHDK